MDVQLEVPDDFHHSDPVLLVNFCNGQLDRENATGSLHRVTVYERQRERTKHRKVLVAETDHLQYVGTNYPSEGEMGCTSMCKYIIGAVDTETKIMSLHRTELFNARPFIQGHTDIVSLKQVEDKDEKPFNFRQNYDEMVTSFGSEKAKKELSARKRNTIESSALDVAMATAISHAEEEMKEGEVFSQSSSSSLIPPCNHSAAAVDKVYCLDTIISDEEMRALKEPATALCDTSPDELQENDYPQFVRSHLSSLTTNQLQKAQILLYCSYLITLYQMKSHEVEKKGLSSVAGMPTSLQESILDKFTECSSLSRKVTHSLSHRMKDKIISHVLVLALMINQYSLDCSELQKDFKISSNKVVEHCRALGCTMTTNSKPTKDKLTPKTYTATLKLPLNFPKASHKKKR